MPSPLLPRALTAVLLVSAIVAIIAVSGDPAWMPAHYVAKPLATIAAYEEDGMIENAARMGVIMKGLLADLEKRLAAVGVTWRRHERGPVGVSE